MARVGSRSTRAAVAAAGIAGALLLAGCKFYFTTFTLGPSRSHAAKAQELREEGKCEEAIEEYLAHIQERLAEKSRPENENPYFYYLLIGDCRLQMEQVDPAIAAFERARNEGVDRPLVSERLRRLGRWFEEQNRFEEGIEHLMKFRELDPLLFDLEIDRLHKAQVRQEQEIERNQLNE